jgi:hypothetical protein
MSTTSNEIDARRFLSSPRIGTCPTSLTRDAGKLQRAAKHRVTMTDVRFWHVADMQMAQLMSAFGLTADITQTCGHVEWS